MPQVSTDTARETAAGILERYRGRQAGRLIHILQDVQDDLGYLPRPSLEQVAEELDMPLAEVLRVATFYSAFSLEPRGEHVIQVCMGTACHVKGAPRIMEALRRELELEEGRETTDDLQFTVRSVRCIGCCGLAPAITVDDDTYGRLTADRIPEILDEYA